ncbi:hypothetical protein COX27_00200 [Candidatus Kuenenbacteria bacterium CG23_combo_of_CG06-09_8_20_14_all_36_9]|uniref:Uncharacterized protein n=1 Tax=Candidatus Kuenenbacteria bacterium CG10_big_fil_rev_8_21_14_0_10_36_11 TaxID=1974618 RepID=A0A2M6WAD7_9BACT|nr:MAG: hypothetical protein COX27_00200 [Candidatus Kuenenbacteria bacterium CG23_combo_of_CG06-09_8_20_14_all_36_9]PIT89714.1 MAG: hypothetical protein COU23_02420 [Candidatus Kuenenbacteria bacterium CG10_big_fil_rev_8_21_14_0_10_36_11]
MPNKKRVRTTIDLNTKHFSRYGEFLVSFELSKHGWNVYSPVYDEYIDFIIHKHVCHDCGLNWNLTPALVCKKCGKDFSKTQKNNIIAKKICLKCKKEMIGNKKNCPKCQSEELFNMPTCDKCGGEVEMREHACGCGSKNYETKFRTIQVKSSRVESKDGKSKNTYAVDMKPRDLIKDKTHFYIWCLVDNNDKSHFLVLSVEDFKKNMGESMKGISFFKDQDRQHFSTNDFGKWKIFLNKFYKLE